jgi:hypothetical protein
MRVQWAPVIVAFIVGGLIGQRFNHMHPLVSTSAGSPPVS